MENSWTQIKNIASTYGTNDLFILGKGASADEIDPRVYANSLVIGINDAEQIAPADITVFHQSWVQQGLKKAGFRSRLYLTSVQDFSADGKPVLRAPFVPLTQESSELLMQRLMTDKLEIEEVLFLTALKIARIIADARGKRQNVYLIGFDFDAESGYSKSIGEDYSKSSETEKSIKISVQEFYFMNALYALRESNLNIMHVGHRPFSATTPEQLNGALKPQEKVRPHDHVAIVAELTTNHFGERFRLEKMIRASKAAGADYVKLQKRDVESFYSKEQLASAYASPFGKTFGDYRHQLELSVDDFAFVDSLCKELDIGWFASVLDKPSFHFMLEVGAPIVKLPSTISEHVDYLKYVSDNYTGSVVLSTGMTDAAYERFVMDTFTKCDKLYLLQCNSAYPTPLEDCDIAVVQHYQELATRDKRIVPGYSSHDFGWKASALAVAAGARMLEKHVKLGNTDWAHFDAVAVDLTTPDFHKYVSEIRETELILGSSEKKVNESEHHKYRVAKAG